MAGQRESLKSLKNAYFALRHGQSEANKLSRIVSHPDEGVSGYGLTEDGKAQVRLSLDNRRPELNAQLKIISSDFLRARETAAIIAAGLGVTEAVRYSEKLRERFFGELDGGGDSRYAEVWAYDRLDPAHRKFGVEPAIDVVSRTVALVNELESEFCGSVILLVAHGDVLQLLQTAFEGISPAVHRQLPPLQVAEIRLLTSATTQGC